MAKKMTEQVSRWASVALCMLFLVGLMLGLAPSVHGAATSSQGSITIHMFDVNSFANLKPGDGSEVPASELPSGAQGVAGMVFKLEKFEGKPAEDGTGTMDTAFGTKTGTTGADGTYTFANLARGYYRVTQTTFPNGYKAQLSSFVVAIPMVSTADDGAILENYNVHVYPKMVKAGEIVKTVSENTVPVVGVGSRVDWDLDYPLDPTDMVITQDDGTKKYATGLYTSDIMDTRLDYVDGSVKEFVPYDASGNKISSITVKEGTDFKTTLIGKEVRFEFTDDAVKKLVDANVVSLRTTLGTVVNSSALNTVDDVWNDASISYTNAKGDPFYNEIFDPDGDKNGDDIPKIPLGRVAIDKYDATDSTKKLAGATFALATSEANAKNGTYVKVTIDGVEKDYTVTTDANGSATFTAVEAGTYYLVELTAPTGYSKLTSYVTATVGDTKETSAVIVHVPNPPVTVPTATAAPGATAAPTATAAPGATAAPTATAAPGATATPKPGTTSAPTATAKPASPQTGDATTAGLYLAMLGLGAGLMVVAYRRKKNQG